MCHVQWHTRKTHRWRKITSPLRAKNRVRPGLGRAAESGASGTGTNRRGPAGYESLFSFFFFLFRQLFVILFYRHQGQNSSPQTHSIVAGQGGNMTMQNIGYAQQGHVPGQHQMINVAYPPEIIPQMAHVGIQPQRPFDTHNYAQPFPQQQMVPFATIIKY